MADAPEQRDPLDRIADQLQALAAELHRTGSPRKIALRDPAVPPPTGLLGFGDALLRSVGVDPERARQLRRENAEEGRAERAENRARITTAIAGITALGSLITAIATLILVV